MLSVKGCLVAAQDLPCLHLAKGIITVGMSSISMVIFLTKTMYASSSQLENLMSVLSDTFLRAVWWWVAGKADKGGMQAGEAGLTKRCGQLENALLQGLQQVASADHAMIPL